MQIVTNSEVNETYVLYQCGLAAPSNALLPPGSKVFSIPLTSVSVADTVPLAFIVRLPFPSPDLEAVHSVKGHSLACIA